MLIAENFFAMIVWQKFSKMYCKDDIGKSKWGAAILCFFLGYLGIHRFYAGKTVTVIIWALTAGLCGIGALVDFIVILIGGFRVKANMPLK